MDKKKAIEIARKNAVSIACGVVALIAIAVVFFVLSGMFQELGTRMEASREAYDAIKRLNNQVFYLPKLDLNNPEAARLVDANDRPAFPTEAAIKAGEKIVSELQANSKQLIDLAIRYNQKAPLVRGALPNRNGPAASEFKNRYFAAMEQFKRELGATTTVTQAEVDMEKARIWKTEWAGRIIMVGGVVKNPAQEQQVRAEFEEKVVPTIGMSLQLQRAQRHTMYISDPNAHQAAQDALAAAGIAGGGGGRFVGGFGGGVAAPSYGPNTAGTAGFSFDYHPGIPLLNTSQLPDVADIWAAQLGLWIQEDVVKAIVQSNAGKRSVKDAVVKRLVRIDIPKEYITRKGKIAMVGTGGGMASIMAGRGRQPVVEETPAVETASTATALVREYANTPTGRVCNSVYDVMHFNVKVDIDPTYYEAFLANLTNNRFITVLRAEMKAVDREEALQNGFVYLTSPVVQVDLKCEAIFFRKWTNDLVPKDVKELLRLAEQMDTVVTGL